MTFKYKTSYGVSITKIEIERESEFSVWVNGNRSKKFSNWEQYHETSEAAYEYLESEYANKLKSAAAQFKEAKEDYKRVLDLKH